MATTSVAVMYSTMMCCIHQDLMTLRCRTTRHDVGLRHRWREATRTGHEIEIVAEELRGAQSNLPRHNAPDMVAAIREGCWSSLNGNGAHVVVMPLVGGDRS
jgi:hypothetical protein